MKTTEKIQIETSLISFLDKKLNEQSIKYQVSKQMFCDYTNSILDYRTAIIVEIYNKNTLKLIETRAISPKLKDKIEEIKQSINNKNFDCKIYSLYKTY
jgi:hypothetical protein